MGDTPIEWTDKSWNPVRGCSRVSPGCVNCYAERTAARFIGPGLAYEGLAKRTKAGPRWTGKVVPVGDHLEDPFRWKTPTRIFVNSMSDLFHESLTEDAIADVFAVMYLSPRHTFQVLTKRAERMHQVLTAPRFYRQVLDAADRIRRHRPDLTRFAVSDPTTSPHRNVWLGVSVEDQQRADERIPFLLKTPAAVRFLSCEPLLGAVDLALALNGTDFEYLPPRAPVDWVIVGGESGPGARPCNVEWIREIVRQCAAAGAACFVKQLGAEPGFALEDEERRGNVMPSFHHAAGGLFVKRLKSRKGGDPSEWPADLRVRQFPEVRS